jgi:serine/threonine protein kinase
MATGKRPWSQQFQEVVALFRIGTTKSHPPIPEHVSHQGKDFLLKCLQREPTLSPSATELLKHPFVLTCEIQGGLDGSEDLQQQQAGDGHFQQQGANRGDSLARTVKENIHAKAIVISQNLLSKAIYPAIVELHLGPLYTGS